MTVLFLITTFEKGIGGHYFSLKTTVECLASDITPIVINIGRIDSPIIKKINCLKHQFIYNYFNYYSIQKNIHTIIKENQVDRIHCFDDRAYLFIRSKRFYKIPLVLTKCGGPNPKYYPKVNNLILYSNENLKYFDRKFNNKNTFLVPNRTSPFNVSVAKVKLLKEKLNLPKDAIVFLRISRISNYYKKSIEQSIELVKNIKNGVLIIIGQEVDKELLMSIKNREVDNVHIVSDEYYYKNAKEVIPICDFYIGTGRGIMEAASLKKILLSPVSGKLYPALLNVKSFNNFFNSNFSERNKSNLSNDELLEEIIEVCNSELKRIELQEFSFDMFVSNFNIESKKKWYLHFYQNMNEGINNKFLDKWLHFIFFHYYYITQS